MSADILSDIAGWAGAIILLLGFYLNTAGKISSVSRTYLLMNIAGSLLLCCNAYYNRSWPFVIINVTWVIFSIRSLIFRNRQ